MTQRPTIQVVAFALFFLSCSPSGAERSDSAPVLTSADRAAISTYYAELQEAAGSDSIVDLENPALRTRIQPSSHRRMKSPEVRAELRHQHAHGRVIVAAVAERDGTVSNAKVVVPSGYPSFDELARRALGEARYDEPTKLDGKPVRCFFYAVFDFNVR